MFAHLLDHYNFQLSAAHAEYQPVKTGQNRGVLPSSIAFQCMAAQARQCQQFVEASRVLDNIDALNVFARYLLTECLAGLAVFPETAFKLPCFKLDDQLVIPVFDQTEYIIVHPWGESLLMRSLR